MTRPAPLAVRTPGRFARTVCAFLGHVNRRNWSNPDRGARCPRCGRVASVWVDSAEQSAFEYLWRLIGVALARTLTFALLLFVLLAAVSLLSQVAAPA